MRYFFLLLFLVPTLIYAKSNQEKCTKVYNKGFFEWNRHNELIEDFKRLESKDKESGIYILDEAMACCRRARERYDYILKDMATRSKSERKEKWRVQLKKACKQNKDNINAEIDHIQTAIHQIRSNSAINKAHVLYQESGQKAALANTKSQDCPRNLNNIDTVVASLNEAAQLYEQAAMIAEEALTLIESFSYEADKDTLKQVVQTYQQMADKHKKEAAQWPASVIAQKIALKNQVSTLKEDSRLFEEKGLKRSSYELQKQAVPILEQLIESGLNDEEHLFQEELSQLKNCIALFEKEADSSRLTESAPLLSTEEFRAKEDKRREIFFKNNVSLKPSVLHQTLQNASRPFAIALDGQTGKKKKFTLYTEQFYRFLVQSNTPVSHLLVKVCKKGEVLYEEKITLPLKNTMSWERYLTTDGLVFIPETKLKSEFGIDLRLNFICDPHCNFSLIIAQKSSHSGYQLSISLDEEEPLYECNLLEPPPWQLGALLKPSPPNADRPIGKTHPSLTIDKSEVSKQQIDSLSFPVLDQLVEDLKGDPLLLAQYVYHEIALVDPFLREENGILQAPGIQRNPYMTYLEQAGSAWEQCQLLVYLLRKAGYQASYVMGDPYPLPKAFVEKMLFTRLSNEQQEALLQYPWVIFSDGKEVVSLFPWMKETQISEGYDLYNFMPEEYASADRWILRYLKSDERILKHIGPDKDDTAAVLFSRFVEEELRKQGLSLADMGIHRTLFKKQFASWSDFPRPKIKGKYQIFDFLDNRPELFASVVVEIFSQSNPQKYLSQTLSLASLNCSTITLWFSLKEANNHRLHVQLIGESEERFLDLDPTDHQINVKISYTIPIGSDGNHAIQSLSMAKGTTAALCFHSGSVSPKKTLQFHQQFSSEKAERKRLHALLSFVGASYFEKCARAEELLAALHKVNPTTVFTFGLVKLSSDNAEQDLMMPQVDMFCMNSQAIFNLHPHIWNQETHTARMQFEALKIVDSSSNEHQILREVFKDPYPISTVKLLQLAHQQQQKKGKTKEGFLSFTPSIFEIADKLPEAAQSLYFSHLKEVNLRDIKATSPGQWHAIKTLFNSDTFYSNWAYAYMTPGITLSQDGTYKEIGTLILYPYTQYALISHNNFLLHGGLGSPLPPSYFTPSAIRDWQLVPISNSYTLQVPFQGTGLISPILSSPGTTKWIPDVRLEHKSFWNAVGDPVDVVTGAFYVDEVDLSLPGAFPIEIRRNYNSQNPLLGDFGCGWKLNINPFLIEQEGKLYAAESDGTIIAYSFNKETSRWEVFPEDNPDLCNFNQKGIGGYANPFHAYIENDVLYGSDGSKRFFEASLLKKWINTRGNTLTFSYNENRLSRIESSNGDFCGLHYNHEGKISEIYAKDGRRVSYEYNSQGDLIKVVLPNTAAICYEYDRFHRIIRETRPHGKVLENIYDEEGRVKEQRSPMGIQQQMITTAIFTYQDGITTATDASGGTTTYKIFQKQIYKVTDPLGYQTLQSWFIDKHSWFDPETEQIIEFNQPGSAPRSLKTSTDKRGLTTYYFYDNRGNVEEIGFKGDDLTGNKESSLVKKLIYNAQNLCIQEEVLDQKTLISYDTLFPYLIKRIEKYQANILLSYVDLEYNTLGQIEKEDHSGAITLWKYETHGFPYQKTQITGTNDPDINTIYFYNNQGQCIQTISVEGIQENNYDIMGNAIESLTLSSSGSLLSATYIGYNLNNDPIWKQTANSKNTLYLDYHAAGLLKATRQNLHEIAYTLYEYDPRGYLIEEVDSRGYCTYRDYDALGKVTCETKEGLSTFFSYEPGGLLETITTPSGAQTTRQYTTNGLLKEESYPDGTKSCITYDFFGRPILETKKGISWGIKYDDHKTIRTHLETKATEIQEFDARGNLIRFTDTAGYVHKKTYDALNRLKTETTPSGEQTTWNYQGDTVICTLPSKEQITKRYEAGRIIESKVTSLQGILIASSSFHYDPETDQQELVQGEEVTTTWINALGLPIKVQKGSIITTYKYDICGNCIASIDADGRVTRQTFDGLSRITQKELPDGSCFKYVYDLESNLIEYHLPNLVVWKASYDSMNRKCTEEIQADRQSSQRWEFTYENGYLKKTKDPLQRTHTYLYDSHGRLVQNDVAGWHRKYTYDPRGYLTSAEQLRDSSWLSSWIYTPNNEHSLIERSYDSDGRLILEALFLNSTLIQQTHQKWRPSSRTLKTDEHQRDFTYQNNQLIQVSTQNIDLTYTYDLSSALISKNNRLMTTSIDYNSSALPKSIYTQLPDSSYQESLDWYPSGKLFTYLAPQQQKQFTYNAQGYLESTGTEEYAFDFAQTGTGLRTTAPNWHVPQNGLDAFGKITTEISNKKSLITTYNPMGQVTSHNERQFEWDPWGRLLKVTDKAFTWEASYDALGRRLQTRYTPYKSATLTTTSLYDPEEEFQEIGVKCQDKTFWKIYGPNSCDAISDESEAVFLIHNALGQLAGVVTEQQTRYTENFPSAYGPTDFSIPSDLLSYAQSLTWHSKSPDPTNLIWMGERYYDATSGRFLSPDPISYPLCLDLYTYANGDPINYIDPDGRFASQAYQTVKPLLYPCQPGMTVMNGVFAVCANIGLTRSSPFEVGSFNLSTGAIGFINGINNNKMQARLSAQQLSQYAQGAKIYGTHNATNFPVIDVFECAAGHIGFHTPPVQLLKNKWKHLIASHGPQAKFLEICHSGGADHLKNALLTSPESVRQQIIALAIAPSVIIPRRLCFQSDNYISRRDFVTHLDFDGKRRYGNELHVLEPHPDANKFWDHEFLSPTFKDTLERHIVDYVKNYGGKI
ncbi:DUF6531 domain-containing protein [Candidatus Rhabdochlamydia sp. T3358]|uniref:DUF6531 domain-containing protein n=2 Tax=Candidatus Rhabdochlamydia sp. T3358 TaxID=2099795 RepID=UPI0014851F24|nr:DUF6531 domain-containing protein [Candidatus Rhabdochlamydia sp. T3358]